MQVKLGYRTVEVVPLTEAQAAGHLGMFMTGPDTNYSCNIGLNADLDAAEQAATLIHELLHAAFWLSGIRDNIKMTEEEACERVHPNLTAIIHDNPELLAIVHLALNKGHRIVNKVVKPEATDDAS